MGLSVFDLLLPAIPLSLLDILILPLLLLLIVPLPAALLPGLLHGLKLARHVPLVFALLWHIASGHRLSGSEESLWFDSESEDEKKLFMQQGEVVSVKGNIHMDENHIIYENLSHRL